MPVKMALFIHGKLRAITLLVIYIVTLRCETLHYVVRRYTTL